jgi:hypothetical protein
MTMAILPLLLSLWNLLLVELINYSLSAINAKEPMRFIHWHNAVDVQRGVLFPLPVDSLERVSGPRYGHCPQPNQHEAHRSNLPFS